MISYDVHHDRAFWGIGFPVGAPSADEATIDVIENDLEGRGNAMLEAGLQGLDLAIIADAIVCELDWKLIEHKKGFIDE